MPTHGCHQIPRGMAGSCLEMGLNRLEVIGSLHVRRRKLEEYVIMVGRPQHQPTVIGEIQALVVTHGPRTQLKGQLEARAGTGYRPASQGLSTLGGGTVTICPQC